jgi:Fe-S oxidoreductase
VSRPSPRPLNRLPMLEARRSELEKCVFCPKLCRSACPVSNAEPKETLIPWGKMSTAYFVARGDVPVHPSFAEPAWACTGCYACRESCDHRNDVASTLFVARDGLVTAGVAPAAAVRTILRFPKHESAARLAVRELATHPAVRSDSPVGLLIGCVYARAAPKEAVDAILAASSLVGKPVALIEACCGLPLLHAGDRAAFGRQALTLAQETARFTTLIVVDAGCGFALRTRYAEATATLSPKVELLVERAARELGRLSPVAHEDAKERVRFHDPCQLGRGLGLYEAPRAVLTRVLGRAPDEFDLRRERAACSGAGGLLPSTMPDVSRAITDTRLAEHARRGGGRVVTACASSLLAMRKRASAPVDDLVTWIARAAPGWRT